MEEKKCTTDNSNSFGDVLNELMLSLPRDASLDFLKCLTGLSADESNAFSIYISKLKDAKQFRVIQTMSTSTVDGKRKFIQSMKKKIQLHEQAQQEYLAKENQKNKTGWFFILFLFTCDYIQFEIRYHL